MVNNLDENPYQSPRTKSATEDGETPVNSRKLTTGNRTALVGLGMLLPIVGTLNLFVNFRTSPHFYGTFIALYLIFVGLLNLFIGIRGKTLARAVQFSVIGALLLLCILLTLFLNAGVG